MLTKSVVFLVLIAFSRTQNNSICPNLSSCGDCIQQPECVWCRDPEDNAVHCQDKTTSQCKSQEIVNNALFIEKDDPLSYDINHKPFVQIQPQRIKLKILRNQEHSIKFKFVRAQNPVDLYFLMDASYTMKEYKDLVSDLAQNLVDKIKLYTTEYKLGFGSFVDKAVPPYNYKGYSSSNCKECVPGYSFNHNLNLTENVEEFKSKVKKTKTATNIDPPEGGLEALMQVIVCTKAIGWRNNATRIVVFTTDDLSHIAGDGRLGGAIFPNDGNCHMEENNYHKDKEFDYPSVSQVSYQAEQYGIHVIFAIAEGKKRSKNDNNNIQKIYKEMMKEIKLSKYSKLSSNTMDIIEVVVETYKEIIRSVKMSHNFDKSKFDVKFKVKCSNTSNIENNDECNEIKIGEEIEFEAIIKPIDCSGSDKYVIKADGIDDSLTIDLEVICTCECENDLSTNPVDSCNKNGYKKCGKCECFKSFTGRYCECSDKDIGKNITCIDSNTKSICNDKGICNCGVCNCNVGYYGTFCLCEDFSCPRKHGELCSGKDQGNCKCGKCNCLPGWMGTDCSCSTSKTTCIAPYSDGTSCSGQGECNCGKCQCKPDYFGEFCEGCIGCEWCQDLDPCVKAYLEGSKLSEANGLRINCSNVNIIPRENATSYFYDDEWNKCLLSGASGCNTVYKYKIDDKQVLIEIGEEICSFVASVGGILLVTLLPILIAGIIAFLVWKAIVTVKDGKEYARFIEKRKYEKWSAAENPLYKEANVSYKNPSYYGKSKES